MIKNIVILSLLSCVAFAASNSTDLASNSTDISSNSTDSSSNSTLTDTTSPPKMKMTKPFEDPVMHSIGTVLMFFLIALSNAGGLSGAGSNIPIMLIFFTMDMKEAVPISGFVAVVATVLRFVTGFSKKHPHSNKRTAINYEVV